jgi:hypothetical protein
MRPGIRTACVRIALLAGGALLFLAPSPAVADSDLAGRWSGVALQSDGQTFPAIMIFDRQGHGESQYPSLDCSGKLSGAGSKGAYRFRETIAGYGRAGEGSGRCIDGTITISVSGDVMTWSWAGEWKGKPITAAGTLRREPAGE